MSGERTRTNNEPSRRLPPPEAWQKPDKWIDLSTGLVRADAPRLVLPTDSRGFIVPDQAVSVVVDTFFNKDYDWPYDFNDSETLPDDHHFYYDEVEYAPEQHNGNTTAKRFRELPINIGRMPRQMHNTFHDLTKKPDMPEHDDMGHNVESYQIAFNAFKRLFITAKRTVDAMQMFPARRGDVALNRVRVQSGEDMTGELFMKEFFVKHFTSYSDAVDAFVATQHKELILADYHHIEKTRPGHIVRKLGKVVNRQSINFTPGIRSKADVTQSSLMSVDKLTEAA